MGTSQTAAKNKYNRKNYDRINYVVEPGMKKLIKREALSEGNSVNRYISNTILEKIGKKDQDDSFYSFSVFYNTELVSDVHVEPTKVRVRRYTLNPGKQIFYADEIPRYKLGEILELRCWDKNRVDIADCLNKIGLSQYNPYEICKRTHGITFADRIWFRYEGEMFDGMAVLDGMR